MTIEARNVTASFGDPALVAPVLERLVSTAAAQADMPAERLIDMLTAVDALASGIARADGDGRSCHLNVAIRTGGVTIQVECADAEHAEDVLRGAEIPGLGQLVERFADSVDVCSRDGDGAGIDVRFSLNGFAHGHELDGHTMQRETG